jgi:hypothetical protein
VEPDDDITGVTAALRSVGAKLDALSQRVDALAVATRGDPGVRPVCPGTGPCPQAERYREALRDAVQALERTRTSFKSKELGIVRRSLEALLFEVPR